ncbi:acyl carrier protein [Saccharothrix sp. AJ9571]|nr:acyl carrier protein [Saccharothrix sp. AJ9571]
MTTDDASQYHAQVKQLVCDSFHLSPDALDETTPFDELGLDSKQRVQLLATLEVFFEVTIDLDERDRLTDVAATAGLLADALRAKAATPGSGQ